MKNKRKKSLEKIKFHCFLPSRTHPLEHQQSKTQILPSINFLWPSLLWLVLFDQTDQSSIETQNSFPLAKIVVNSPCKNGVGARPLRRRIPKKNCREKGGGAMQHSRNFLSPYQTTQSPSGDQPGNQKRKIHRVCWKTSGSNNPSKWRASRWEQIN